MKQSKRRFLVYAAGLLLLLLVAGCGRPAGYGVILWPDSDAVAAGEVVAVIETASVQNTYIVRREDGEAHQLPHWRVRFFDSQAEAAEFAERYSEYAELYVRSQRNALPVREQLDRTSRTVYRLRQGEEIKVLDRTPEPRTEAGLTAHWYSVLTEDGTSGWVFGYYLTPFSPGEEVAPVASDEIDDPVIRNLLENTWRPAVYAQMIRNNTIDLDVLRPEYGLFSYPDENRFRLESPERSITFDYREITQTAARQYAALGSSLQFALRGDRAITIQYIVNNQTESVDLELIDADIEEVRTAEIERRDQRYEEIYRQAESWRSSAYGRITLYEDGTFEWTGNQNLVPTAIPRGAGSGGTVEFPIFLSASLRGSYQGVISFRFNGLDRPVHFLYNLLQDGIRLTHLPQQSITRNVATSAPPSSIVAFFAAEGVVTTETVETGMTEGTP